MHTMFFLGGNFVSIHSGILQHAATRLDLTVPLVDERVDAYGHSGSNGHNVHRRIFTEEPKNRRTSRDRDQVLKYLDVEPH